MDAEQNILIDEQLRSLLDDYALARSLEVDNVAQKLDALTQDVAANGSKVDALATAAESAGNEVVTIDQSQWQEMQEAWQHVKNGLGIGLFLALLTSLVLAAILGNGLWGAFSRGWRR